MYEGLPRVSTKIKIQSADTNKTRSLAIIKSDHLPRVAMKEKKTYITCISSHAIKKQCLAYTRVV